MNEIVRIPGLLSPDTCKQLIDSSEASGYSEARIYTAMGAVTKKNRRNNSRLEWRDTALANNLWNRLVGVGMTAALDGSGGYSPHRLSETFKFYRYTPGQYFGWHRDGSLARGMTEKSFYTLLFYLNDNFEGGTTDITDRTGSVQIVKPLTGTAVAFEHHLWHQGAPVTSGAKYLLRPDVLFKRKGLYD